MTTVALGVVLGAILASLYWVGYNLATLVHISRDIRSLLDTERVKSR